MLEPAEPSLLDTFSSLFDNMKNAIKENPEVMIEEMQKIVNEKDEKIEELELELKEKRNDIQYLMGKIDAYEYIIKDAREG